MNPELVVIDQLGVVGTAIYGLKVAFISMSVVFMALIILIGIIRLMTMIIVKADAGQSSSKGAAVMPSESTGDGGAERANPIEKTASGREGFPEPAVLAVITAAVASYMEMEKRGKVGMIRREDKGDAWVRTGRNELIDRDRLRRV
jgi:Na+-transporting methylmalonyl-CoA/oxaloacetate decarboxylase gamma subunit